MRGINEDGDDLLWTIVCLVAWRIGKLGCPIDSHLPVYQTGKDVPFQEGYVPIKLCRTQNNKLNVSWSKVTRKSAFSTRVLVCKLRMYEIQRSMWNMIQI